MKTHALYAFIFSILLMSCRENVVAPSEDSIVSSKIIGRWEATNWEVITFNKDGSFLDAPLGSYSTGYEPMFIFTGKYTVRDAVVYFEDVTLAEVKGQNQPSSGSLITTIDPKKIVFHNDTLTIESVKVLNAIDNNGDSLRGTWECYTWVGSFEYKEKPILGGFQMKENYTFNNDSLLCSYKQQYVYPTSIEPDTEKMKYNYSNAVMDLGYYPHYRVEFKDKRMYWFYNSDVFLKK